MANYNSKAKFGRSKERRYYCPLLIPGLVPDGDGFSKRSRVFEGKVSESRTLEKILEVLKKQPSLLKPLAIIDAGIAKDDKAKLNVHNLKRLKENQYQNLAVSRRKKRKIPQELLSRMAAVMGEKLLQGE